MMPFREAGRHGPVVQYVNMPLVVETDPRG